MEEERIPKKGFNGKFLNKRSVEKPRTRWEDIVHRDALQILGLRSWRRRPGTREEWRPLLKEARAQKGCTTLHGWTDSVGSLSSSTL
jgi:hypothetical protein